MAKRDLQETVEYALGVLNKACQNDEAINQNKAVGKAMAALSALAGKDNRPQVLIEVNKGMLEIVTDGNVPVIVYDFDDIKEGDAAGYPKEPAEMVKDFEERRLDCEKRRREYLSAGDETCVSCDADVLNAPLDGCTLPDSHSTEG